MLTKSRKLDVIVAIFFAGIITFSVGLQIGHSWTGNWNTLSNGYMEIGQVNATQYYWNDENRTILFSGQNATESTAYVGFDSNLDYLPNYWLCDGTADDVQIQMAVNYACSKPLESGLQTSGAVKLLAGWYDITQKIIMLDGYPLKIGGEGIGNTRLELADNVNDNMFEFDNSSSNPVGIIFSDFHMIGNFAHNVNSSGIYMDGPMDGHIVNMFIEGFSEYNVYLKDPWAWRIYDSIIEYGQIGGVFASASKDFRIHNTKIIYNENGIELGTNYAEITNCFIYHNNQNGIQIIGGINHIITDNHFIENSYDNPNEYDHIYCTYSGDNSLITNNIFDGGGKTRYGIWLQSSSSNDNITIQENNFYNHATAALNIRGDNHVVKNNYFIYEPNGKIITTASNTVIKNNVGYVTENSGTQTCADNEDIAHGLVGTPTFVDVTPMNDTYDSVVVIATVDWSNVDSTNIQVGLYWINGTAISDDIVLVSWKAEYEP